MTEKSHTDHEKVEAALEHLENYDQDDSGLVNWSRVVKARELLRETTDSEGA